VTRFLMVTWDGAGNLVPTLGIARALSRRGHDVRVLGQRSIDERCGSDGWRFRARARADSASAGPGEADMARMARDLWFGSPVALDVRDELAREPADVLIGDCMLMGALAAGEAAGLPTVALFHAAFALFRRGPLADMFSSLLPLLNTLRSDLGLPAVNRISDVYDSCALSLVTTPREFEPDMPLPPNVRFVGPVLDSPPLMKMLDPVDASVPADGAEPLVVVSFSTSRQGQLPVLQRVVHALASLPVRALVTTGPALDPSSLEAAGNVRVVQFVPHDQLFPRASLVVTHAGLGTIMMALAHGLPLLCLPLGRDQFFNAARVETLGAGRVVPADADANAIREAIRQLLQDEAARQAARGLAVGISKYRNGADAVVELERIAG
jgi:MGT family glycosyltransferase